MNDLHFNEENEDLFLHMVTSIHFINEIVQFNI